MDYKVIVTEDAEKDLDGFVQYLLFEIGNEQAAKSLLDDFDNTICSLALVAGRLKYCEHPKLKEAGYKRINFMTHRYFILYHLDGNRAVVDNVFHQLQDYENILC